MTPGVPDTTELIHRLTHKQGLPRVKLDESQHREGQVSTKSPPNQDAIHNRYLLGKGQPVLSKGMSPQTATTAQARLHAQE